MLRRCSLLWLACITIVSRVLLRRLLVLWCHLGRRIRMSVVDRRLIASGGEFLRIATVQGVYTIRSNLPLKSLYGTIRFARCEGRIRLGTRFPTNFVHGRLL